jgi:hypothetical protein
MLKSMLFAETAATICVSVYFLYVVELLLAFNFYEEFEDTKGV